MDNAYQAIVVVSCPSCDCGAYVEMPTQEIYDGDKQKTICINCQQEIEFTIKIQVHKIDEPPF